MDSIKTDFENYLAPTCDSPMGLEIIDANGIYLYDIHGKEYMDLISGIGVSCLGHKHPKLIKAIKEQVDKYLHIMAYGEYIQSPQTKFAKKLAENLPPTLSSTYFVNSGTEANEAAIKLAKRATGRTKLVACRNSYHGSTHGSLSLTDNENKKYHARPLLPEVYFMDFNSIDDLSIIDEKTAGVIIEPIQGDAGVRIPSQAFMTALRKRCDETGTLLIFDEVQTGFGRTGKLFAFEHFNVIPDIITLAKGLGGGMPIGALVASKALMQLWTFDPMLGHITTFGGHPVSCAAGLATLTTLTEDGLIEEVERKGQLFESLLQHSKIKEIRRIGLLFAIELSDFDEVHVTVQKGLKNGFIGFWFLSTKNAFRIAPPLIISDDEIRKACNLILMSLND